LGRHMHITTLKAGDIIFSSGDPCENFVVISHGTARVQLTAKTGREIILFRLEPGQACALTTSCLLTRRDYYAEGIAETELDIIMIPARIFRDSLRDSPELFTRLLSNYAQRIGELTAIIDRLITRDLKRELCALLLSKMDRERRVTLSHQKIADELGSAREVISRKLKAMEREGLLALGRGQIDVLKPRKL
ncbi:MAG: Crp/Fnr family transcriptional regulator, partial [Robiginitomaculum sp.]